MLDRFFMYHLYFFILCLPSLRTVIHCDQCLLSFYYNFLSCSAGTVLAKTLLLMRKGS